MTMRRLLLLCLVALAACGGDPSPRPVPLLEMAGASAVEAEGPACGPLRVLASNPRFLTDGSGRLIWLAGAHTWNNFQDWGNGEPPPALDYAQYLAFLRARGHNFTRLWTWEQAAWLAWETDPIRITPLPYLRPGPGLARDGRPRFDLHRFDQAYFDRLRDRVHAAGAAGIYVSVMLFNGWSLSDKKRPEGGNPWRGHPFNRDNNVSGIDGDPDRDDRGTEIQTLLMPEVTALQKAYVAKAAETLNDSDNMIWEISNESEPSARDWQYEMVRFLRSYEATLPKQHLIGMSVAFPDGVNDHLFAGPADWIAPRASSEEPYPMLPSASEGKVVLNDTDHIWGIGGNPGWVWKSLLHGMNAAFMDPYKSPVRSNEPVIGELKDATAYRAAPPVAQWESIRANLGYARAMARRCDLAAMAPADRLVSPGSFCLAKPGREYLVFVPARRGVRRLQANHLPGIFRSEVTVDLSERTVPYSIEWLDLRTGELHPSGLIAGGGGETLSPPFAGDAVLHLSSTPAGAAAASR